MIIPLIFGAFGNFLLPTQLGVHDVAFPRLNSAAFWFLPGGLIMLMQLVCVDRRYNRMNCFNIRELQGILKRRFFTDLVNSADHRDILSSSMIGLRFKTNNTSNLDHDTLSFFKLGTIKSDKFRSSNFQNSYFYSSKELNLLPSYLQFNINSFTPRSSGLLSIFYLPYSFLSLNLFNIISSSLSFLERSFFSSLILTLKINFSFISLPRKITAYNNLEDTTISKALYTSSNTAYSNDIKSFYSENNSFSRFSRFSNPIISYDYKCGNYIGI
jgi:hypothetical protein